MNGTEVIGAVQKHVDLPALAGETHEPRGIFHSEMAAAIGLAKELGIDLFIESGRARGFSTYLLATYLGSKGVEVHSFDRSRDDDDVMFAERRLAGMPNLFLHYADACKEIPSFIRRHSDRRVAVLLDGPKGRLALELMAECCLSPNVVVGFIHDMPQLSRGVAAPARVLAKQYFPGAFFTDDAAYVERFKELDTPAFRHDGPNRWQPYHHAGEYVGSYGPTLAVIRFTDEDRRFARDRRRNVKLGLRMQWAISRLFNR